MKAFFFLLCTLCFCPFPSLSHLLYFFELRTEAPNITEERREESNRSTLLCVLLYTGVFHFFFFFFFLFLKKFVVE